MLGIIIHVISHKKKSISDIAYQVPFQLPACFNNHGKFSKYCATVLTHRQPPPQRFSVLRPAKTNATLFNIARVVTRLFYNVFKRTQKQKTLNNLISRKLPFEMICNEQYEMCVDWSIFTIYQEGIYLYIT